MTDNPERAAPFTVAHAPWSEADDPENHVLPYEGALHMAAEMLSRIGQPEEINAFDFKWCIHSIPPEGANLWRFHMELVSETRTRILGE